MPLLRGRRRAGGRPWPLLAVMISLTGVSVGYRLFGGVVHGNADVADAPHTTVFSMTAGAALAVVYERGWRPGRWAGVAGVLVLSAYFWLPMLFPAYAGWVTGPAIYTLLALALIGTGVGTGWWLFAWHPLRALGSVSYGWHLWHFPLTLALITRQTGIRHVREALWLNIVLSLLVAALSWRYLERPLQRRFRHRLERARLDPGPAAPSVGSIPTPAATPDRVTGPAATAAATAD
jgi:peptidoglycan/LPS O-acetylase OafA/YrhL